MRLSDKLRLLMSCRHQSSLAQRAATLLSGSVLASLVNFIALPFISRLYEPNVIGVGVVFLTIHAFLMVVVTGRYQMAIPLPRREESARYLFWFVALLASVFSIVISGVSYLLREPLANALSMPNLAPWLPYMGVAVATAAYSEAAGYLLIREQRFRTKALLGVGQAAITVTCLLVAGWFGGGSENCYMTAQILGMCVANMLAATVCYPVRNSRFDLRRMLIIARHYKHLPQHMLTTSALNAASVSALPLLISAASGSAVVAVFSMAALLVDKPLGMISSAIWQVVYVRLGDASSRVTSARGMLFSIYGSTSLLYCVPIIFIVAFPDIATALFGEKWHEVGAMMELFILMSYFQYTSNSVSYFQSFGKYAAESAANTVLTLMRIAGLMVAAAFNLSGYQTVAVFCLVSAVAYLSIIAYWSQVLGLGFRLPVRGLQMFVAAYAISHLIVALVPDSLWRVTAIGVLLAGAAYGLRKRFSDMKVYANHKL